MPPRQVLAGGAGGGPQAPCGGGRRGRSPLKHFPWGETRYDDSGEVHTGRLYTGQIRDTTTGLYYYNARYYDPYNKMTAGEDTSGRFYDPALGRFIQPDRLTPGLDNPQALNRYSYVFNRPLSLVDPDGHYPGQPVMHDDEGLSEAPPEPVGGYDTSGAEAGVDYPLKYTSDEKALARMIWNEERAWGDLGMRTAAWVAVNRLDVGFDGRHTLMGVLTQKSAFCYPCNDPLDPRYIATGEQDQYDQALAIARQVLNRGGIDESGGALFFGNGEGIRREMEAWAAAHPDSGFWWMNIEGTDMYVSNQWYREEE